MNNDNSIDNKMGASKVSSNFIYNRPDLYADDFHYITLKYKDCTIEYYIINRTARLGVWCVPLTRDDMDQICKMIFKNHQHVLKIEYENAYSPIGKYRDKNHFRILLPKTVEELQARLSKKGRYNIQREERMLTNEVGNCIFSEYLAKDTPEEIFQAYFEMKKVTHGIEYGLSAEAYIKRYNVSDVYVLYSGDSIAAILLSCEQCPIVYIENLTYRTEYSKYSPGQILYNYYLNRLVEKGFEEIFLAGGNLDYKKRYGSIEEKVYDGAVFRYKIQEWYCIFIERTKTILKKLLKRS